MGVGGAQTGAPRRARDDQANPRPGRPARGRFHLLWGLVRPRRRMARHAVPRRWTSPRRPHGACPARRPACASTRSGGCVSEPKVSGTPRTSPTGDQPDDFEDSDLFRAVIEPEDQGTDDAEDSSADLTDPSGSGDEVQVLEDGDSNGVTEGEADSRAAFESED